MFKKMNLSKLVIVFFGIILLNTIQLSYADYDSFTVNIPNAQGDGYTAVVIKQSGQGYVGPQGEYYPQFPSVSQLQALYGGGSPAPTVAPNADVEQPQDEDMDPRVSYFYDSLSPYGQWINNGTYGMVWAPNNVSSDWRPYSDDGHWALTDYGWTWVSDLPWGWAAFHYGRWFYDNTNGWLWYPDRVWAPCWVAWRSGGDWIGWAPLPPEAIWREGVGLEFHNYNFDSRHYNFCRFQDFTDPHIRRHTAEPTENFTIINVTNVTATNIRIVNGHVINQLPFEHKILETAGHPIARLTISNLSKPGIHKVEGNELLIFHPAITAHSKPPVVAGAIKYTTVEHPPLRMPGGTPGGLPAKRQFLPVQKAVQPETNTLQRQPLFVPKPAPQETHNPPRDVAKEQAQQQAQQQVDLKASEEKKRLEEEQLKKQKEQQQAAANAANPQKKIQTGP